MILSSLAAFNPHEFYEDEPATLEQEIVNSNSAASQSSLGNDILAIPYVAQVSATENTVCALLVNETLYCWGKNSAGQLGINNQVKQNTPQYVDFGSKGLVSSIGIGETHSCAILKSGALECWGDNSYGKLGIGSISNAFTPQTVTFNPDATVKYVDGGESHTCAVLENNSLYCWGNGEHGRLGNGSTSNHYRSSPQHVDLGTGKNVSKLAVGGRHNCAILNDNSTKCWGYNVYGQLGIGNYTHLGTPQTVSFGSNRYATDIFAGKFHTCAILDDNSTKCWGNNFEGQLGIGSTTNDFQTPQQVTFFGTQKPIEISASNQHTCAVLQNGTTVCTGVNTYGELGIGTASGSGVYYTAYQYVQNRPGMSFKSIMTATFGSCGISINDELLCWGRNLQGELGIDSYQNSLHPVYTHLK